MPLLRPRPPFVHQMEAVDCGAASLTMVLRHFGHHAELTEVREAAGVSRDGVSAKSIVKAARRYGLVTNAMRLEPEDLAAVAAPAILHWEMNHFVVFDEWTARGVKILDPAVGPRTVSHADFDTSFTGVCIELKPGEGFVEKPRQRAALARYAALLRAARGPLALLVLSSVLLNAFGLGIPVGTQIIVDRVLGGGQADWLPVVGAAVLVLIAAQLVVNLLRAALVARLRGHLDAEIGVSFVRHLLSLPIGFLAQRSTADLVGRVQGVSALRDMLSGNAVTLLVDGAMLVSYLALCLAYEWRLGLVVLAGVALYAAAYVSARPGQVELFRERVVKDTKRDGELFQALQGILTLKSAGREESAYQRWQQKSGHADAAGLRESERQSAVGLALLAVRAAVPAAVLLCGAWLVMGSRLSLGELLAVLSLQALIFGPLQRLVATLMTVQELPVQLERMDDVLLADPEPSGPRPCPKLEGRVTFDEVSFRYGPTAPLALEGVSFEVQRGEKIALVGPSGSGKSTLGRLLTGLHRPESGRVLLDGHDLSELDLTTVRRRVGVVLQETSIFEGTIAENIALYSPGAPLSDVVEAARVAQVHHDIEALPEGYDTRVSASACPLSGGQRQRLALARALLHRPAILLLDEATSALDSVTEAAVEQFLASRLCTRIVIAHRLSTVRDADRILVFEQGKVVEQGRHAELVASGGLYARLAASQESAIAEGHRAAPRAKAAADPADLAAFSLFAHDEAARGAIAPLLERRVVAAGTAAVQQGERGTGLLLVESGQLDLVLHEPGLPPFKVGEVGPGGLVGELSLLEGSVAVSTASARTATRALHLPQAAFDALRAAHDPVAARIILGLGRVLAGRLRSINEQYAALGHARRPVAPGASPAAAAQGLELSLAQTTLGAALTAAERDSVKELGEIARLDAGQTLFRQGDAADRLFLVLRGRVAVVQEDGRGTPQVTKQGELLGEEAFFDTGERADSCQALEPSTVFAIDHARLRRLLLAGGDAAWKILRHLVQSLVGDLRLAMLHLREAAAAEGAELEAARRAREEAERLAREEDQALAALADHHGDRVPVVLEPDPALGRAACLTAVLRHHQRPIRSRAVVEACSRDGKITAASMSDAAAGFGMLVRRDGATAAELRAVDRPLIVPLKSGGHVVVDGFASGRFQLMDPRRGRASLPFAEAAATLSEDCLEVLPDEHRERGATLAERIGSILRRRRGALAQLGLTTLLLQLTTLAVPAMTAYVLNDVLPSGDGRLLYAVALGLLAVLAGQALTNRARDQAVLYLRTHLDRALLQQLLRHVLRLPVAFFELHPPGEVVQRFTSLRVLRTLLGVEGIAALLDLPTLALGLAYLVWLDASLAVVTAVASVAYLAVFALVLPGLREMASEQYASSARERDRLIEVIAGATALRLTGDAGAGLRLWAPLFGANVRLAARQDMLASVQRSALQLVQVTALLATLWWGASRVLAGSLSIGAMMAFLAMAASFLASLDRVLGYLSSFLRAGEALRQLGSTFAERAEQAGERVATPGKLRGRVTVEGVSFGYRKDGPKILKDISLDIAPGSKVALVGASGSGKSTLGRLLLGFYAPDAGRIRYDGRDLRGIDVLRLRNQLGVVMQESFLFSGSIRQNLSLGAPTAALDKVVQAAKKAAIHDDIEAMPMKYETMVAEGGSTFSGGQRQRVSLARALVHEPAILLLDEATSALDNLAQRAVEEQLAALSCTRIVIAHRLSTIIDADQIVVLERGEIVEQGTHDELMKRRGHYRKLVDSQL